MEYIIKYSNKGDPRIGIRITNKILKRHNRRRHCNENQEA